jgi:polysaccharide pyruvyl transferase WcaK-like protein
MNILIDNGATKNINIGDISMLEGVVELFQKEYPDAKIFVGISFGENSITSDSLHINRENRLELRWIRWVNYMECNEKIKKIAKAIVYTGYLLRIVLRMNPLGVLLKGQETQITMEEYCSKFDGFLLAGGGYLNDIFLHEIINKIYLMESFAQLKMPFILTGQQIGPFKGSVLQWILKRTLAKAKFIGLREGWLSPLLFDEDKHFKGKYRVCGDDSLGVRPASLKEISKSFTKNIPFITVNYRFAGYAIKSLEDLIFFGKILEKLQSKLGYPYVMIPIALDPEDSDITTGQILKKNFPKLDFQIIDNTSLLNAASLKAIFQQAFCSIGVSYHFCTFSLSVGTPSICFYKERYYEQKAKGLADYWEDTCCALKIDSKSCDEMAALIKDFSLDPLVRAKMKILAKQKKIMWERELSLAFGGLFDESS